jgi:hypothetical protein
MQQIYDYIIGSRFGGSVSAMRLLKKANVSKIKTLLNPTGRVRDAKNPCKKIENYRQT